MNGIVAGMTVSGIMIDGIGIGGSGGFRTQEPGTAIDGKGEVLLTHRTRCVNNHETIGVMCEQCDGSHTMTSQDFDDAEMVVIRKKPYATTCNGIDGQSNIHEKLFVNHFKLFAIYGSKIIESEISGDLVHELSKKTKIIWADRKPYILNGDHASHINYGG